MKKRLYIDLETTGLDSINCAPFQIAGMIEINGEIVEEFDFKLKPFKGAIIENGALDITGITIDDLKSYTDQSIVWKQFVQILSKWCDKYNKLDKFHIVGYNCQKFDTEFLRQWFIRNGDQWYGSWFWANSIDLYSLCSLYLEPVREQLKDFKLGTVATAILGQNADEDQLHDAKYDIYLTKKILDKISIVKTKDL